MITLKTYVKRLEKMLDTVDKPCMTCPAYKGFSNCNTGQSEILTTWLDPIDNYCINWKICQMCRKFVGAKRCPCFDLGPKEAIKRAHKAIREFWKQEGEK